MVKISKERAILEWLQEHDSINPMQALRMFRCMSLSQRICDLKSKGYQFEVRRVGKSQYAEYHLIKGNN